MQYFYLLKGQACGPKSLDEIRQMCAAGILPIDVQVAEEGSEQWQPIGRALASQKSTAGLPEPVRSYRRSGLVSLFVVMGVLAMIGGFLAILGGETSAGGAGFVSGTMLLGFGTALERLNQAVWHLHNIEITLTRLSGSQGRAS